jgi:hypothetical protein
MFFAVLPGSGRRRLAVSGCYGMAKHGRMRMSRRRLNVSAATVLAAGAPMTSKHASVTSLVHALAIGKAVGTDVVPVWARGF